MPMRLSQRPLLRLASSTVALRSLEMFLLLLLTFVFFAKAADTAPPTAATPTPAAPATAENRATVLVVVGVAGEEEFGKSFVQWAANWEKAAGQAHANYSSIGLTNSASGATDHDLLQQTLEKEPKEGANELWIIFLGHGTFNGKETKFNLRGPDFTSSELAAWIKPFHRPVAIIDCSAASAPFINELTGPDRVIVTATKSGNELNYTRFGRYVSEAIGSKESDIDKDGQTSLLEAFLSASRNVNDFYETEGRLATEHALLDDNGDGRGTPADWFRGVRAVKKSADGAVPDGLRAHQFHLIRSAEEAALPPDLRAKRDQIEMEINKLRESKTKMQEVAYYGQLETLFIDLAKLYESNGQTNNASGSKGSGISTDQPTGKNGSE